MKNVLQIVILLIILMGSFSLQAQTKLGIKGGFNFTFLNEEQGNFGANQKVQTGYYFGAFTNLNIKNKFNLQPELLFISLGDFKFLNAPIYFKYNINDDFNILVGPSINYFFDFFNAKLKVRVDLGLTYNLSSRLDLQMKYTIGFEEIAPNGIFLGLGFKL
ncbi:outer membrane beta-barrel protein [Winogradskyella wichelsiae]|uniref:outer membrane beta-barrel protein n=1 Tax=Winogradskyella wichelsiae TaxID=2697007 RepID=UPI0015CE7DCB|nr:outer membrane beta-barrel protein [Winogradskyella wichelsiae]